MYTAGQFELGFLGRKAYLQRNTGTGVRERETIIPIFKECILCFGKMFEAEVPSISNFQLLKCGQDQPFFINYRRQELPDFEVKLTHQAQGQASTLTSATPVPAPRSALGAWRKLSGCSVNTYQKKRSEGGRGIGRMEESPSSERAEKKQRTHTRHWCEQKAVRVVELFIYIYIFLSGQTLFKVVIKSLSPKELVRIHIPKPLDRNDGTFLMRYRMYETVNEGLKIEVLYGDEHVAQSPYILKGPVYHEYCECPEEDPQAWQKTLSCPTKEPQIAKDFASFPSINLQQMLNEVPKRFGDERGAIVHYTILNNHIYRRSLGKYTDFKMFSDEILLSLARKVLLPDLEFYVNLGDWPLEHRKVNETPGPLPIISWCGSLDSRDVILPTYDITHSTLEAMRGVTNDLLSIQGNTGPSWINKTEKAFFRGRDSREERLQLVQLAKENPQLLDAGITGYFFFQEKEKELGKAKLIGFFDFFKYKYQVNVDGTVAAYRYPYLMLGDSLVLKQDSPYYEHFYLALKPWKHYVPIKRNLSDLLEKVKWAKENDGEAKKIAKEGQLTARELLQPHRLYCYYYRVLQKYAERQSSKPEIRDGMELVPQPKDNESICQCHRKRPLREEL
nr:PREDICTED: KDEL motif-containing protein 2 [Equus przewalskii]